MTSIPSLIEDNFSLFLSENYTGAYTVLKKFGTADFVTPSIIVGAGKLAEIEPGTGVFAGKLNIAVITQIDETTSPVESHDEAVSDVWGLIAAQGQDDFNSRNNGHLWSLVNSSFEQDRHDRTLITIMEWDFNAQNLAI